MKTRGSDTDTGVHFQADPKVHPEILQLAEVSSVLGGAGRGGLLAQRTFPLSTRGTLWPVL